MQPRIPDSRWTLLLALLPWCSDGGLIRTARSTGCTARLASGLLNLEAISNYGEDTRFVTTYAGVRFTFKPCTPSDEYNAAHGKQPLMEAMVLPKENGSQSMGEVIAVWKTASFRSPAKIFCRRNDKYRLETRCPLTELISDRHDSDMKVNLSEEEDEKNTLDGLSLSEDDDWNHEDGGEEQEEDEDDDGYDSGNDEEGKEEAEEEELEENMIIDEQKWTDGAESNPDGPNDAKTPFGDEKRDVLRRTQYPANVTAIVKLSVKGGCRGYKMFVLLQCNPEIIIPSKATFQVVYSQCANKLHFLLSHRCCCEGLCDSVRLTNELTSVIIPTYQHLVYQTNTSYDTVKETPENGTFAEVQLSASVKTGPKHLWLIIAVNVGIVVVAVFIGGICCKNGLSSIDTAQQSFSYLPALYSSRGTVYSSKDSFSQAHAIYSKSSDTREYTSSKKLITELPQLNNCLISARDLELGPRLGGGFFGDTYIADWKERTVAAKRITVGVHENQRNEDIHHWLLQQVTALSKHRHKFLAAVIGVCIDTRHPYVLTQFIDGETVKNLLEEPKLVLKWQTKMKICMDVAEALAYLHSRRSPIVHRDLRCANVIVDQYKRAKVVDFGMTKLTQRMRQLCDGRKGCFCNPELSALPASVRWTAPEILRHPNTDEDSDIITTSCDVYSFAIIMWEMASHADPYEDVRTEDEVIKLVLAGGRPKLTKLKGMIREIKDLMILCWDSNPDKRPTAKQVLGHLKKCVNALTNTF